MANQYYPFVNLPLKYDYDSLEPFIDKKTMTIHHNKHLQAYINNLNNVLKDNFGLQRLSLEQLIKNSYKLECSLQSDVRNNAGGIYNHRFFFDGMTNPSQGAPDGSLLIALNHSFKSIDNFKEVFKKSSLSVFGSGYSWLVLERENLKIVTTPNQTCPLEQNLCPVICLDVWEHSYYLKYQNLRAEYIDSWFNVVDWSKAKENYESSLLTK